MLTLKITYQNYFREEEQVEFYNSVDYIFQNLCCPF